MGKVRFQRIRRLYRGMESLALVDHGDCPGRNVHHHKSLLCDWRSWRMDARQQMVRRVRQLRLGERPWLDRCSRISIRQMAP